MHGNGISPVCRLLPKLEANPAFVWLPSNIDGGGVQSGHAPKSVTLVYVPTCDSFSPGSSVTVSSHDEICWALFISAKYRIRMRIRAKMSQRTKWGM